MKKRQSIFQRKTNETDIKITLDIDGSGVRKISTPIKFLNHMLDLFIKHGLFNININALGDFKSHADEHHTVEDIGIVLGQSFAEALGDKKGINRYGFFILPMDEVLVTAAVDFAGRSAFTLQAEFKRERVGDLSTELVYDFWNAFAQNAKANVFIRIENGRNDHHKIEAIFKAMARAVRTACEIDRRAVLEIPSTKGVL